MCAVLVRTIFWISCSWGSPGIVSRCYWQPFFIIPSAPTITGTVLVLSFHILCISISRSLYLLRLSNSLAGRFWPVGMLMSMRRHVFSLKSLTIMSGRLACIVLSVRMVKSHSRVTLSPSTIGCGLCSYQCSQVSILYDFQIFQCRYWPTLSCRFLYSFGARTGHPDTR